MLIQCTKKLLDELKMKPGQEIVEDDLFSWHANIITINRKKTVVMVNDKNRYAIVFYGLKAKDFKQLAKLLLQGIRKTFEAERIKEEVIDKYLLHSETVSFVKTKNRTCVSRMNRACETVQFLGDRLEPENLIQIDMSMRISKLLAGEGKGYITPNEEMYKDLEEFVGTRIFTSRAAQLKITLKLRNYQVWRRLVVPLNMTFNDLHNSIQSAFNWRNYHLHKFTILDQKKNSIANLRFDLETSNNAKDTSANLSEYIPTYHSLIYTYDFGDNWEHHIEFEKIIEDYDFKYPTCLDGEGNAPPEDVGGEPGFQHFLTVIGDPAHPEHHDMTEWARIQRYEKFALREINWKLKKL
ncbi:plasmid pRiA4b ORF-3 family protein [Fredinandcohnia sp. 179-A 10B2 NHS]|uniref:plasmid pRiA4b ORF-3 family protein n=1 Tax=Fredinandcohnia sp. 179-A 10B2 NHS TaxID=3235176 RepID=UPI0039A0FC2B